MTGSTGPTRLDVPSAAGVTVVAYRWAPPGAPRAVVRLTHGMGEHALRYAPLAEALTAEGYVVYAQDHRGHGATMADEPGVIGADGWTQLVADIGRLGHVARAEHPGLPHGLIAHSMGSFAAQQYLLDHSADVDAVVLTGTAALDLMEPALDLDQPLDLTMFNAAFAPARTDYDWLSRDPEQVDRYVADPLCGFGLDPAATKAMFLAGRRAGDAAALAGIRSDLPVLVAVGEQDPVGAGLALVQPLVDRYRAAGLKDVTLTVYAGARHEVFNETNRAQVVADLTGWLGAHLLRG
jgi:alpha-beta hydrolase superfamily lysophospholipase